MTPVTTFFTSDLHFGHPFVAHLRGFGESKETADTAAHDNTLIEKWVKTIHNYDTIWVLGDLVGHHNHYNDALTLFATLPGRKHLITGNHDVVSPIHRNSHKYQREYLDVFESVQPFARIKIPLSRADGSTDVHHLLMSHFPYRGVDDDHTTESRYTQYRLPDEGNPLLHGHTHNATQTIHYSDAGTAQIHVGVDAWDMTPVPAQKIGELLTAAHADVVA